MNVLQDPSMVYSGPFAAPDHGIALQNNRLILSLQLCLRRLFTFMKSLYTPDCNNQGFQLTFFTVVRDIEVICSVSITRRNCVIIWSIYNTGWLPLTVWPHPPPQVNRRITSWYRLIWRQASYVVSSSIWHGLDENLWIVVTRNACQLRGAYLNKWCCEKNAYT